jgi:hypothetical protein
LGDCASTCAPSAKKTEGRVRDLLSKNEEMKITFHKDGTCTVHRVDTRILHSLLNQASIHQHTDFDPRKLHAEENFHKQEVADSKYGLGSAIERNIASERDWYHAMRTTLFRLHNLFRPKDRQEPEREHACTLCGAPEVSGVCIYANEPAKDPLDKSTEKR